ncbi:MAG: hypothetical protein WC346_14270 [Methanogenium sp.]
MHEYDDITFMHKNVATCDLIIDVNITDEPVGGKYIHITSRAFTRECARDNLYYVKGQLIIGSTLIDKSKYNNAKKRDKRLRDILTFLDVTCNIEDLKQALDIEVQKHSSENFIITFMHNGIKAIDSHAGKFTTDYEMRELHRREVPGVCHICGSSIQTRYDTCGFNCYTNNLWIFHKTEVTDKQHGIDGDRGHLNYCVCRDCIIDILAGIFC